MIFRLSTFSGVIDRYREFLPVNDATPTVSLGEGSTPLVRSRRIGDSLGCRELYFKLEGCNPTGSFKDRGMVVATPRRALAGGEVVAGVVRQQRRDRIEHRNLDVLASASRVTGQQGQRDSLGRHHASRQVGDGYADTGGRPVGLSGQIHQAGLALHDQVVTGSDRIGT